MRGSLTLDEFAGFAGRGPRRVAQSSNAAGEGFASSKLIERLGRKLLRFPLLIGLGVPRSRHSKRGGCRRGVRDEKEGAPFRSFHLTRWKIVNVGRLTGPATLEEDKKGLIQIVFG